jgi:hypothetical protein
MNTEQLSQIMLSDKITSSRLGMVCASDELPSRVPTGSIYIINTDPSWLPGQHWVAVNFETNGYAEYFDSFGKPPRQKVIEDFLNQNSTKWTSNMKRLQSIHSNACGHYIRSTSFHSYTHSYIYIHTLRTVKYLKHSSHRPFEKNIEHI